MGESIRTIIEARGEARDGRGIRRGDAYALNDPYRGGTHLPDITVIMPVFYGDGEPSRRPSSRRAATMPTSAGSRPDRCRPTAASIADEGVLIDNVLLLDEGRFCEAEMRALARQRRRIRRAVPTAISPTCAPRSPPARAAPRR